MILSEARLREVPAAFWAMTGLWIEEFDAPARDVVPAVAAAEQARRSGRQRRRAVGGGHPFALSFRAQLLLAVVRLRVYPTAAVLGFLFGVSHPTVLRTLARVLPLLEQAGRDTGQVVDVPDSVCGPTQDLALLQASALLDRLDPDVGALGDLADVGIAALQPAGLGCTPRRRPRAPPRPPEDVAYNTAFAAARISVEHTIGRLRRYRALTQPDRHHRRAHAARVQAVAGLVNRQLAHRFGALR